MAFMAAALPYIAGGVAAISAISSASAQSSAAKYNAQIARQNADMARQQGEAAQQQQQREAARKLGAMRAAYGASGVDIGSGSPLDVLADSASQAELDRLTIKYNYDARAIGYDNTAMLEDAKAENAKSSGVLNAIGSAASAFVMTGGTFSNPLSSLTKTTGVPLGFSAGDVGVGIRGGIPIPNYGNYGF